MTRRVALTNKVVRGLGHAMASLDAGARDDMTSVQESEFQAALRWWRDQVRRRSLGPSQEEMDDASALQERHEAAHDSTNCARCGHMRCSHLERFGTGPNGGAGCELGDCDCREWQEP